jgi:hypothetical protein
VFEARGRKPVIAVSQDIAASAALWIGSAASEFVVTPASINGSIGVVLTARPKEQDSGDIEIVSSQSPRKREDPGTETGRASLQRLVDDLAQVFVETVARNRDVSVQVVLDQFGRGGVMGGAEAVKVGMANRLGTLEQVVAGFAGVRSTTTRGVSMDPKDTPAITREFIAANHPAIAEAFRTEGHKAGLTAGADAERARIKSIHDLPRAGHETLLAGLMFDGKSTAGEAALAVLAAEKTARTAALNTMREEAPNPVKPSAESPAKPKAGDDKRSLETRTKEAWDNNPELRAEFADDFDRYFAYEKAAESGQVRVFKGASAQK